MTQPLIFFILHALSTVLPCVYLLSYNKHDV